MAAGWSAWLALNPDAATRPERRRSPRFPERPSARPHGAGSLRPAGRLPAHGQRQDRPHGPARRPTTPAPAPPWPTAAPETETQRVLCEAWSTALGVERVGIDDDYFTLGGDSIRSIRVVALAREKGVTATLPQLFTNPTVRRLSAVIETEPQSAKAAAPQTLEPFALISDADRALLPAGIEDAYPLTRLQAGMLFHGDFDAEQSLYQDLFLFRLRVTVDATALEAALSETIAIHPALRTSFDLQTASQPLQLVHAAVASP